MYCVSATDTCSKRPPAVCLISDGSAANPSACACGSEDCETAGTTGMHCYASQNRCRTMFIGCLLMMATSTLLWYLQPPDATGDQFDSIPATFYLSILMLTGQGTPDGVLPWYTKLVVFNY